MNEVALRTTVRKKNGKNDTKKVREVTKTKITSGQSNEDLKKEMEGQKKKIAELEEKLAKMPPPKPPDNRNSSRQRTQAPFNCYRCGEYGHAAKDCKQPDLRPPNGPPPNPIQSNLYCKNTADRTQLTQRT